MHLIGFVQRTFNALSSRRTKITYLRYKRGAFKERQFISWTFLIMSRRYFAVTVLCFIALSCYAIEVSAKTEKDLWRYLFEGQDYDKQFRPVRDPKTAVQVTVGLAPISMEETSNLFYYQVEAWLVVKWKDEYLTWNPKDFGNIEQLNLPISKVWSPSLFLYPGKVFTSAIFNVSSDVVIRFDGELMWMSPNSIVRKRELEQIDNHPGCIISIISWTYDVTQMNISINSKVNEIVPGVAMKTSRELRYFSWRAQPYSVVNFTLSKTA